MDNELLLFDRIEVIKATDQKYDLQHNAYLSFSGGKDSTILHHLLDLALPGNRIPRVFINTGIEYQYIAEFVKDTGISVLSMPSNFNYIRTSKPKHLGGDGACEIAFKEHTFTGKSVIIFDDVITSGGTIQHYKRIIEEQGGTVLGAISIGETMYSRGQTAFQEMSYKQNPTANLLGRLRNA